jgi:hypothetical protein
LGRIIAKTFETYSSQEVAMSHRGRLSFLVLVLSVLLVGLAVLPQTRFFLTGIFRMEHWYLGQPPEHASSV